MIRIAVFASGTGTNAEKIIEYFRNHQTIAVSLIVCNKLGAGVISIAEKANIPVLMIDKNEFFNGHGYLPELKSRNIDFIVLAGFLWKIPPALVAAYPSAIVNIHPALLPNFGGKGMYGSKVHQAVLDSGEQRSGITIHFVDEQYDNGDIIFQAECPVLPEDSPETLAQRIHTLEHQHYPRVIEQVANLQKQKWN